MLSLPTKTRFARVGSLGRAELPAGYYVYTGSALGAGGIEARIRHHCDIDTERKPHWHLDYIRPAMTIEEIWINDDGARHECEWATLIRDRLGGDVVIPGFGSSDCGAACPAHLYYFDQRPSWEDLRDAQSAPVERVILP